MHDSTHVFASKTLFPTWAEPYAAQVTATLAAKMAGHGPPDPDEPDAAQLVAMTAWALERPVSAEELTCVTLGGRGPLLDFLERRAEALIAEANARGRGGDFLEEEEEA